MEALTNSKIGSSNYLLNKGETLKKLQIAAVKPAIEVTRNKGSNTVHFNTGAYVTVVGPLVKQWKAIEGDFINSDLVDDMDISVDSIYIKKDDAGTIEHYLVKLTVDGHKVTVTCFDTTLTVLVQAGHSVLEPYCSRALFPHLQHEIEKYRMKIKEYNHMVLSYNSAKPNTRRQHQQHLRGASALAGSPRLRTLSSPGTPLEQQVAALQSPASLREEAPLRLGMQLLEDVSLLTSESSVEVVTLEEVDREVRSSTPSPTSPSGPSPPACYQEVVTTRSQVLPDLGWMHDLNTTIESPPSPAPSPSLLSLQEQVRTLVPAPVEQAVEHLFELLEAAVPGRESLEEPAPEQLIAVDARVGAALNLGRLQPPLVPTPAKAPATRMTVRNDDFDHLGDEKCVVCGDKCESVKSLQEHIVTVHVTLPNQVLNMLKKQQQAMNQILANQSTQEKTIAEIVLTQKVVLNDIKESKKTDVPGNVRQAPKKTSPCCHTPTPASTSSSSVSPNPPSHPTMAEIVAQPMQPTAAQPAQPLISSSQQHEPSTHGILSSGSSLLYIGDSIFRNVYTEKIEKVTKAEVKVVKAYSSSYDNNRNNKFKSSNFTDLLPKELENNRHDAVAMQASSTDLTNYRAEPNKEKRRQIAQTSNSNMLSAATAAAASHPNLKKIVLFERAPRFDDLEELNIFANQDLHLQWQKCDKEFKNKVVIGNHNLKPHGVHAQVQKLSRWGDPRKHQNPDQLHLKGSSGMMKTTDSVLAGLAAAGLIDDAGPTGYFREKTDSWQEAGGRREGKNGGRRPHRRQEEEPFQLPLHNRYGQGNY